MGNLRQEGWRVVGTVAFPKDQAAPEIKYFFFGLTVDAIQPRHYLTLQANPFGPG
jgi:hypothetical protein